MNAATPEGLEARSREAAAALPEGGSTARRGKLDVELSGSHARRKERSAVRKARAEGRRTARGDKMWIYNGAVTAKMKGEKMQSLQSNNTARLCSC